MGSVSIWHWLIVAAFGLWPYLLPTLIARRRKSATSAAAVVVDIVLGWTLIGWVVALALACSARRTTQPGRGVAVVGGSIVTLVGIGFCLPAVIAAKP